jgi:hypothetical protein
MCRHRYHLGQGSSGLTTGDCRLMRAPHSVIIPSFVTVSLQVARMLAAIAFFLGVFAGNQVLGADAKPPDLNLVVAGEAVTVFSKSRNACDTADIPDAPARAIRTASGAVQLYASHFYNRRLVGPDLLHLSQDCRIVYEGNERDEPAAFDDRAWITGLYTPDGSTIFAVVHNEFQGHRRPSLCPGGRYIDCWYNSITAGVSRDGGEHFNRVANHAGLIATLPYRYDEVVGHHVGYFNPSNIIMKDGALFMTVFATEAKAQTPGNCLLRTDSIADPAAWRGWDGESFKATFIDPYRTSAARDTHVCVPVGRGRLRWPVTSLVLHQPTGLFIALMMNGARDGGVFYATSPNLVDWSSPMKLMNGLGEGAYRCGDAAPVAYPSLIDVRSSDRNFMIVGSSAELFLTRFNPAGCKTSMDRDLTRTPISISNRSN